MRKFKGIFRPKTGDLRKKKVFTEISRDFLAEIGNSSGFSGRNQVTSKKKVFTEISRDFPAEIGNSSVFSGRKQVTSKKKVFTEISRDFPAEIGISSGFSRFKFTKNTNLGLDLRSKAPNLLISSRYSPRLGGHNFRLGRAQAVSWGGTAPVCPPGAPGLACGNEIKAKTSIGIANCEWSYANFWGIPSLRKFLFV